VRLMLIPLVRRTSRYRGEGSDDRRVVAGPRLPVAIHRAVGERRVLSALLPNRGTAGRRKCVTALGRHEVRVASGIAAESRMPHDAIALTRGHRRGAGDDIRW